MRAGLAKAMRSLYLRSARNALLWCLFSYSFELPYEGSVAYIQDDSCIIGLESGSPHRAVQRIVPPHVAWVPLPSRSSMRGTPVPRIGKPCGHVSASH
jgi:hypothetical protein